MQGRGRSVWAKWSRKASGGNFPGTAMVKTACFQCRGRGLDLWSWDPSRHLEWLEKKDFRGKQYLNWVLWDLDRASRGAMVFASLVAQRVKNLPAMWETRVWSLGWEVLLEKEMATHSSILASRISQTEEPGGLQSMGSQRVGHDWATNTYKQRVSTLQASLQT